MTLLFCLSRHRFLSGFVFDTLSRINILIGEFVEEQERLGKVDFELMDCNQEEEELLIVCVTLVPFAPRTFIYLTGKKRGIFARALVTVAHVSSIFTSFLFFSNIFQYTFFKSFVR